MPTPSVDENELLYRQVGPGGNPIFYDGTRLPPLHRVAFMPTRQDVDGLSLIRARFRAEIWAAHRVEQPDVRFRLARMTRSRLDDLANNVGIADMGYRSTPDGLDDLHGEPWGHCVATEINRLRYDADPNVKKQVKEWALKVADSIAAYDVIGPFSGPTQDDPYRP